MKLSLKLILLFCLGTISYSCGSSNKQTEEAQTDMPPLEIVDLGLKSFPLDAETAVDFNSRFKVNVFDGKEYLSFANRPTSRIYEFDYETGEPTRIIKLEKEGPNQVNLFFNIGYFFHSKDSIFIDSGGMGYYLLNGNAEIISKFGTSKNNSFNSDCCPVVFTNASFYKEGKVFGPQNYSVNDEEEVSNYTFGFINISDNSKSKKLLKLSEFVADHKEIVAMELKKDPWVQSFKTSFYYLNDLLYASSPISDSVHVFKNFELVDTYHVGKEGHQPTNYRSFMLINQIQHIENGYQNVSQTDQPTHFGDVFVSPDGNIIYRLLIEATRGRAVETLDYEIPEVAKASLVVFDKSTGQLTTFDLPAEELEIPLSNQSRSIFVSSKGIHFQTKEQVNEDRLDFRFFGVKKID